jgi:hypothetical protein
MVAPIAAAAEETSASLPLARLIIPLPPNSDAMIKERAMVLANHVVMQTRSCADLPAIARQLQGTIYTRLGSVNPKDLDPQSRGALAMTGPGEAVKPFFSPAGLEMIFRCDGAADDLTNLLVYP